MVREAPKDPSEITLLYCLGIYINPGMARLLVEYLRRASEKYKRVIVMYVYWWPDVPPEPFVGMVRDAGISNLDAYEEYIMASPQFGAMLGWKGASLWNALIHNWRAMRRIAGFFKREKVDIIHFILTEYQTHYLVSRAARMAGAPKLALSFTGVAPPNTEKKRFFNRRTDHMLDRVITATEIDRARATEEAFPHVGKSVCRGFGLAPGLFAQDDVRPERIRQEYGIPPDAPVIGTTTRIAPGKGQDHLIRALPKVIERYPSLRVLILGGRYDPDQPYTGELNRMAEELGIGENIIFTGERNDTPDIFANYLFAVHFPDYDHLPFGVLECGAMEIPTIATSVGGVPEIIVPEETGILLDTHEPDVLAEEMLELLSDSEKRKRLGSAMREFVLGRYNLDALVDRVFRLHGDLLRGEIKEIYE